MAVFTRRRKGADQPPSSGDGADQERRQRVLVLGGRGYNADACVDWDDAIANVIDFDSVVVIPPTNEPSEGVQWKYHQALQDLLLTDGSIYIIATPAQSWPTDGRRAIMPPGNYDWCPVPIRVEQRHGESIEGVDEGVAWLFSRVRTWSCTVEPPPAGFQTGFRGNDSVAISYETERLAANRAGQALALRTRLSLHHTAVDGYFHQVVDPAPLKVGGWVFVIPAHAPWRVEEIASNTLATFVGRQAGAPVPEWLTEALMPPTPAEDGELQELDEQQGRIDRRMPIVLARRADQRRIAGLLYETGAVLEALVAEALSELGVALSEPIGNEEYLALHDGVLAAVEVKGNSKSASGDDYRAAMDHALRLTTDGLAARAILVVCAWRNTPLDARREWFPSNVQEPARTQGTVALVKTLDLYRAVLASREGKPVDAFVNALFAMSGPVGFADGAPP